ncbi:MAG: cell division protein FtsA [Acidobacteria bacterium]|nr:cell division protein FtsA [Acidobacteriota bacterium]
MPKSPSYVAGLDLGSSRTRCVVGVEENGRLRCVSYGAARSGGWRKGAIVDQDPVVQSIEQAVAEAEANGELSIESVVVGVGGTVSSAVSTGPVSLPGSQPVERAHVNEAVKTAARARMGEDRTLLQAIPIDFSVDGQGGIRNPLGMMGRRLDAQVRLITASTKAHMNLTTVVNRAGIVVEETVFEPFAAALATIEEHERQLGVAVADMGAGSTDLVAYLEDQLCAAVSIPIGGDHFTRDVSYGLRTSEAAADRLIQQYGNAVAKATAENSMIEVPPAVPDGPVGEASRRMLNEILEARAEDLFVHLEKELERAGLSGQLIAGLVITGGVAQLAGLADVAEQVLHASIRVGLPAPLYDLPEELDQPGWTAAVGLLLYAQRLRLHRRAERDNMTAWLKSIFAG